MRELYILLLVVVFGVQAQAQVCTINASNASQDFCTICSSGADPALVDGKFSGTLEVTTNYTISASCLNTVLFGPTLIISFKLAQGNNTYRLTFERDPYLAVGLQTTLLTNKSKRGLIDMYGSVWDNKNGGNTRNFAALKAEMDGNATYRTLPVDLVDWTADEQYGKVELRWTTTEEDQHDYFMVEHSNNGRDFEPLIAVMRPENGYEGLLRDYRYVHDLPTQGTNYYRLVQYDEGGKATTFDVRSVKMTTSAEASVYPNPAAAGQTIGLRSREEVHEATLFSLDGTPVANYRQADTPLNEVTLPGNLTTGTYVLKAGRQHHRVVVR